MKKGRPLEEVLRELEAFSHAKEDFVVDTQGLRFHHDVFTQESGGMSRIRREARLQFPDGGTFGVTDIAHVQIADSMGIPAKYYNRMRQEAPELLEENVNYWLQDTSMKRMVRTLNGNARAFLSDRYRRLDNEDLVEAMLPVLSRFPGMRIESCEATPSRFYLKAVAEQLQEEVAPGDVVYGGVVISNSEVGRGSLRIEPLIYRLVCSNGMIVPDYGLKKFHIGRAVETDELFARLTDEAVEADDRAFWLKARDVLNSTLTKEVFGKIVSTMSSAKDHLIKADPIDVVERLSKKKGFSMEEQKSVLTNLLRHEESTRFGLSNALTRASQEIDSYERATEFEYLGADILMMPQSEWKELAEVS
jgi:hypothetical protein